MVPVRVCGSFPEGTIVQRLATEHQAERARIWEDRGSSSDESGHRLLADCLGDGVGIVLGLGRQECRGFPRQARYPFTVARDTDGMRVRG
jgi:hypothetical protein